MLKRVLKILTALVGLAVLVLFLLSAMFVDMMRPEPVDSTQPLQQQAAAARPAHPTLQNREEQDSGEVAENRIYGRILDESGVLVGNARLMVNGEVVLVVGGQYEAWVPPGLVFLEATAPGFKISPVNFGEEQIPDGELEHDFHLTSSDLVTVFCAGMPDDACTEMLMTCSHPLLPMGEQCHRQVGQMMCECPDGEVAIRGGGRSVLIGPDDTEAWLDFRDTGSISGRVVASGTPVTGCHVSLMRVPRGLEDISRGLVVAQKANCTLDGTFTLPGLVSGDWELIIQLYDEEASSRVLTPRHLAVGEHADVGDVEMWAGGGIEGVFIDGLTGEPARGEILALRQAGPEERTTPMISEPDGQGGFTIDGLPPGTWRLFSPLSPHESVLVEVEDGAITDGVVVRTSDATALAVNGFELTSQDGALVVDVVREGSPAHDAGLREGDVIVGIEMAGVDLSGIVGEGDDLVRFILGSWDGPGITLIVEHEGEPLVLPLVW